MTHFPLIIYQLMPDRFAKEGEDFAKTNQLNTFCGGNLAGITQHLSHIAQLGANTILLTPILSAPSYHRYDAIDLKGLDFRLGTMQNLQLLIEQVHQHQMKIICDLPLNHVSHLHPWFLEAQANSFSPKRSWFSFLPDGSYLGWWGNPSFPELNLQNLQVQQVLWKNADSVINYWLEKGFDGIRLDCANDLTLPVCRAISQHLQEKFPHALLMGEVGNFAVDWSSALTLIQSYWFTTNVKLLFNKTISANHFMHNMLLAYQEGGRGQLQMLSSHDIERAHTIYQHNPAFLTAARRLQFLLPGTPMIYAGEEWAMLGGKDPANRHPMNWSGQETAEAKKQMAEIQYLCQLRKKHRELYQGNFQVVFTENSSPVVAFLRFSVDCPWEFSLVTWNTSGEQITTLLTVPYNHLYSTMELVDRFSSNCTIADSGTVSITLRPWECALWQLQEGNKGNYQFFKRWEIS